VTAELSRPGVRARPATIGRLRRDEAIAPYLFLLPTALGFLAFIAGPLVVPSVYRCSTTICCRHRGSPDYPTSRLRSATRGCSSSTATR
jgi:hypothetical protein